MTDTNAADRATLLRAITTAAKGVARGHAAVIEALRAAAALGQTDEDFKDYARRFHVGYLAIACQWTDKQAAEWLDDDSIAKRPAKGETATDYQRAYGSSRVAWSRIREAAGFAKQVNKATRAARPKDEIGDDDAVDPKTVSIAEAIKSVRKLGSLGAVCAALEQVADYVTRLQSANAENLDGEMGMHVRYCIQAIAKAARAASQPAKADTPAKPAKVTKLASAA